MGSHSELLQTPGKAEDPGTVASCTQVACAPLTAPTHPPSLRPAAVGAGAGCEPADPGFPVEEHQCRAFSSVGC